MSHSLPGPGRGCSTEFVSVLTYIIFFLLCSDSPTRFHPPLRIWPRYVCYHLLDGYNPCIDEQLGSCRQHVTILRLSADWRNVHVWSNQPPVDIHGFLVAINSQHHERKCHPAGTLEHHNSGFDLTDDLSLAGVCVDLSLSLRRYTKAAIQWLWRLLPTTDQRRPHCWNRPECEQLDVELC